MPDEREKSKLDEQTLADQLSSAHRPFSRIMSASTNYKILFFSFATQ